MHAYIVLKKHTRTPQIPVMFTNSIQTASGQSANVWDCQGQIPEVIGEAVGFSLTYFLDIQPRP